MNQNDTVVVIVVTTWLHCQRNWRLPYFFNCAPEASQLIDNLMENWRSLVLILP
jgi:hypothetical protein